MSATLVASFAVPLREFALELELSVRPGETLALVGPSGAGKSTALRSLAGVIAPRAGRISLGEEAWLDTERSIDLPAERRRCGMLFQDYALFPCMSAWRNVAYGIDGRRRRRRTAALEMLDRFGLAGLADARPGSFSGGERQRVALARALAAEPRALLLDEPLAALDTLTRRAALRELRAVLDRQGVPAILVTHSFEEAALLSDRLAIADRGTVVQVGTAAEISARPGSAFVADFAGAVLLRGEAASGPDGLTLVRLDGGGEVCSVDAARGPVTVAVFPSEISLGPSGEMPLDSVLNRLEGVVSSVLTIGNRARVGVSVPQPLSAEITARSAAALGLAAGSRVTAAWKASATRLVPLR